MSNTEKDKFKELFIEHVVKEERRVRELIIREGKALDIKQPLDVQISGVLDSPLRYIQKRHTRFHHLEAYILIDREALTIQLIVDEHNPLLNRVTGKLEIHPIFKKFGINAGNYLTPHEMAELFKMNRTYFENQSEAMKLVSELKSFKGKVAKQIENSDNNRGNKHVLLDQAVESNVPEKFYLVIPIFKAMPRQKVEVEVYFNANDLTCTLVSPQANDFIEAIRDEAIDEQINSIIELAPDIVIIEK